ncbi:MAG: hypothetical protein IJ193_00290 [Bacilli bacterium]|nr:hypothetical protein [Bacilli bacterium]
MEYNYDINMVWHCNNSSNGTSKSIEIKTENINGFAIFNDYDRTFMPVAYATITINKLDMDDIIKYVKESYIDLKIQKFAQMSLNKEANTKLETPYSGKCVYFIDQDINYNKELDFPNNIDKQETARKQAVVQTISIGLMWDNCIEWNKKINNTTIIDTTMFNSVLNCFNGIPILIEPFKYNDTIDQLIVTPKETLSEAVSFFNNIKVFYDTNYRFYLDPECAYLISSSGVATKKKGELFDTCLFNVRPIDDPGSAITGMREDQQNQCYYADIHVKDTYYTIDNDTTKIINELQTVIDPGLDSDPNCLQSVNEALSNLSTLANTFTDAIKDTVKDIETIPSTLSDYRCLFIDNAMKVNLTILGTDGDPNYPQTNSGNASDTITNAISIIRSMIGDYPSSTDPITGETTPTVDPGEWDDKLNTYITRLNTILTTIKTINTNIQKVPNEFKDLSSDMTKILGGTTNLPGCLNCVTPINMSKNSDMLNDRVKTLITQSTDQQTKGNTFKTKLISLGNNMNTNLNSAKSIIDLALSMYNEYPDDSEESGGSDRVNPFIVYSSNMSNCVTNILKYVGTGSSSQIDGVKSMALMTTGYVDWCQVSKNIVSTVQPQVKNIQTRAANIKSLATATWNSIENIGKTAQQSLDKIVRSAREIGNKVKSLDFNIKSLPDLQKDINIIKDISNIGMLGISSFGVNLKISGGNTNGTGQKIVKIKNDNANVVKNIKNEIETYGNKISISKTGLDTTVFTINKRYVIKNYSAHSNKDGLFILIAKKDFFTRTGDYFVSSTQLDFAKVTDIDGTSKTNNGNSNTGNLQDLIMHANSIVNIAKGGININSLSSIVGHAQNIQNIYNNSQKIRKQEIPKISKPQISKEDLDEFIVY